MELQDMIGVIDMDENGCISFDEFVWLMSQDLHDEDIEDEIRDAFRVFDRDGNGFISVVDLQDVLLQIGEKLSQEEVDELIGEADIDGDGNIFYDEFAAMIFQVNIQWLIIVEIVISKILEFECKSWKNSNENEKKHDWGLGELLKPVYK